VNAAELVQSVASSSPHAVALAEVVSFAVLVDRPLLRQARLRMVPDADAGAEADLWLGPLVKNRSSEGITFAPDVAAELRRRLAADATRSDEAWKITTELHAHLPPTLKLEETVNHLSIDESESAAAQIDQLFASVLAAMTSGGRDGLASWAARAMAAFPSSVRKRSTAQMVATGASLRLGGDPRATLGDELPEWLRFVAPAQLPVESIGVQLAPGVLRVDATPEPAGQLLRLPATRPYLIDVSWRAGGREERRQLALRKGDTQQLDVAGGEVELRTIAGDTYRLRLGGTTPEDVRRYIIDFSDVLKKSEPWTDRYLEQLMMNRKRITLLRGPQGSGKTRLLASLVQRLRERGMPCAYHFFESGTPRLEYWEFARRSLIAQLMTHYDAPSWAIGLRLREFMNMIVNAVGTGPVYIVLDNVDQMHGPHDGDMEADIGNVPPQFIFIESTSAMDVLQTDLMRIVELNPFPVDPLPLPPAGVPGRRFLDALAVARAPLPLEDAERLRANVNLTTIELTPWVRHVSHDGVPSVALESQSLRTELLSTTDRVAAHGELIRAIMGVPPEEQTWYGIRHGLPVADSQLTGMLRRSIELFGATITADILDESRGVAANYVAEALRKDPQQANENPEEIAAVLYSAVRSPAIPMLLSLDVAVVPLRIASIIRPRKQAVRVRPPGRIEAIHVSETTDVVRCPHALLLIREQKTKFLPAPRLTASAVSQHGDVIMAGDADGMVTFWSLSGEQRTQRFAAHRAEVTQVVLTQGFAFSCAADGTITRWDQAESWEIGDRFNAPAGISAAAGMGATLIAGCRNGDLFEATQVDVVVHKRAHNGPVTGIAFANSSIVSAGADRMLRVCAMRKPDSAVKVDTKHTLGITGLAGLPGNRFATYSADRAVRTWSVSTGPKPSIESLSVIDRHNAAVTTVQYGKGGLVTGCADGMVSVFDDDGNRRQVHRFHLGPVRACAIRGDEILTGGDDRQLNRCSFDLVTSAGGGVTSMAAAGNTIAACIGGRAEIWSGKSHRRTAHKATSLAVSGDGKRVLSWLDGSMVANQWGRAARSLLKPFSAGIAGAGFVNELPVFALDNREVHAGSYGNIASQSTLLTAFASNGEIATAGTHNGSIGSIVRGKHAVYSNWQPVHAAMVSAVAAGGLHGFHASGTVDGEIAVWSSDLDRFLIFRGRNDAPVIHLAFAGKNLLCAGTDNVVAIWDYFERVRTATCTGHRDRITALLFDDRSELIYTASLDRTVRVWDLTGKQRGILFGDHAFSALAPIRGSALPGDVAAGDDAGAIWTLVWGPGQKPKPPAKRTTARSKERQRRRALIRKYQERIRKQRRSSRKRRVKK